MSDFNLSSKIKGFTNGKFIMRKDVKEFIRLLKEEFWCENEKRFIDKLAGEELI